MVDRVDSDRILQIALETPVTRRTVLKALPFAGSLIIAACNRVAVEPAPTPGPTPARIDPPEPALPTATVENSKPKSLEKPVATSETLSPAALRELQHIGRFNPRMINVLSEEWVKGSTSPLDFRSLNGGGIRVIFRGTVGIPRPGFATTTMFNLVPMLTPQGEFIVTEVYGGVDNNLLRSYPPGTEDFIVRHETVYSDVALRLMATTLAEEGVDLTLLLPPQLKRRGLNTEEVRRLISTHLFQIYSHSKAIAALYSYFDIRDRNDKTSEGLPVLPDIEIQGRRTRYPMFGRVQYNDEGLFGILLGNLGEELAKFSSFEQLRTAYPDVSLIPGWDRTLSRMIDQLKTTTPRSIPTPSPIAGTRV